MLNETLNFDVIYAFLLFQAAFPEVLINITGHIVWCEAVLSIPPPVHGSMEDSPLAAAALIQAVTVKKLSRFQCLLCHSWLHFFRQLLQLWPLCASCLDQKKPGSYFGVFWPLWAGAQDNECIKIRLHSPFTFRLPAHWHTDSACMYVFTHLTKIISAFLQSNCH